MAADTTHEEPTTLDCPVCGAPMVRVTSHEQCMRCGFILPCCDGDAVICPPSAPESTGSEQNKAEQKN